MPIHTFGDSHSGLGWLNCDIINHELGPLLCYSFGKEKLDRCDIRNHDLVDGDSIIFCLGEIDCRFHIHKHITDTTTHEDIIDTIVANYFEAIKLNVDISQIKFKNVCVYNVVPPVKKDGLWENSEYPFLGTDEERKQYVLYFNSKIKENCEKYNYIFFDIYDKYVDENGFLNPSLSDGNVHIRDSTHVRNFLIDRNI
jgi:hypothetical protein